MKCERSEGVGEAERRERERETREGEKESGWERPSVAMETGSYQLTPCFPLVPHPPPTPFPFSPSPFIFPSLNPTTITPSSPTFFLLPLTLSITTTPLSLSLPHTASPSSIFRSSHQPHLLCFFPPHPPIPRWLHFHPLTLVFVSSPPLSPVLFPSFHSGSD